MPSITTWNRVESASRPSAVWSGLEARLHDPLWMLGRQWQMQEFAGQDAGSPVEAELAIDAFELTRYFGRGVPPDGMAAGKPLNNRTTPLESLVEREPRSSLPWRLAADAGMQFERYLDLHGMSEHAGAYRAHFALSGGPLPGRMIDGDRLAEVLAPALRPDSGAPSLPPVPSIPLQHHARVIAAALEWLAWFESLYSRPAADDSAWRDDRLEYEFCVAAATPEREIVLTAQDYAGGRLDWFDFTIRHGASLGGRPADARAQAIGHTIVPTPVTFPGMPASRWWEFENASVDLSTLEAGPEDPIRLLLIEFALIYGNDWFLMPVEIPVGTLSRVRSLVVTNSFGEKVVIEPFARAGGAGTTWRMFTVTEEGRAPVPAPEGGPLVCLPPVLGPSVNGSALEEVAFLRDETANLVWAVEKLIDGEPLQPSRPPEVPDLMEGTAYRYRLSTGVREYWVPFVPLPRERSSMWLRRARTLDTHGQPVAPTGTLLGGAAPLLIHDEEVPREGVNVRRAFQLARWTDGSSHLWTTRQKQPVTKEGWSGLRFDLAIPTG